MKKYSNFIYLASKFYIMILMLITIQFINANAQSAEETVSYINTQIIESTKSAIDYFAMNKISLNNKGKLTTDSYMFLTNEWVLMESRAGYLKKIKFNRIHTVKNLDGSVDYVIILSCLDNNECISRQVKSQSNVANYHEIGIIVYSFPIAEKIQKAFQHLINMAASNSQYLSKDPFD